MLGLKEVTYSLKTKPFHGNTRRISKDINQN